MTVAGARRALAPDAQLDIYDAPAEPVARGDRPLALARVAEVAWRRRTLVGGVLLAAALLGFAFLLLVPPRYRAVATIEVEQRAPRVLGTEELDPIGAGAEADRFLQTQVDILASRSLAARVADDLHLWSDARFFSAMGTRAPVGDDPNARRRLVLDQLHDHLHVVLPRTSRIVQVGFNARDPALAAAIANGFVRGFIAGALQRRFATSRYSLDFLERRLAEARVRLAEDERLLITRGRDAGLVDGGTGPDGARSLVADNLVDLNQAYAAAQATRIQAQQRWYAAQATPPMALGEVLGQPAIQQLLQRRAELYGALEQVRQRLKPDHPTVQQDEAQLAGLDRQIATLAQGVIGSLDAQFRTAADQERAFKRRLALLGDEALAERARGVRYGVLKRDVDTDRQIYDALLQRYKAVSAEAGVATDNVTMIDPAEVPRRPSWPRPATTLALALLGGTLFAVLAVVAAEALDDRLRRPADIEAALGLRLLGVVPRLAGGGAPLASLDRPGAPLAEAHHAIRTALEFAGEGGLPATLLVTSAREGEGKTTTALALARGLAGSGKAVLLVDADLRRPALGRLLGPDSEIGLATVLAGEAEPLAAVRATALEGLSLVPGGEPPRDAAPLLNGARLAPTLATYARAFDMVVVDGPPLLALADGVRLAACVAATMLVVEADRTRRSGAHFALARLRHARATVVGAVLTKAAPPLPGAAADHVRYRYARGAARAAEARI